MQANRSIRSAGTDLVWNCDQIESICTHKLTHGEVYGELSSTRGVDHDDGLGISSGDGLHELILSCTEAQSRAIASLKGNQQCDIYIYKKDI